MVESVDYCTKEIYTISSSAPLLVLKLMYLNIDMVRDDFLYKGPKQREVVGHLQQAPTLPSQRPR